MEYNIKCIISNTLREATCLNGYNIIEIQLISACSNTNILCYKEEMLSLSVLKSNLYAIKNTCNLSFVGMDGNLENHNYDGYNTFVCVNRGTT